LTSPGWRSSISASRYSATVRSDVRDYLEELRDETWRRRDSAMSEQTIAGEVRALMIKRHPDWAGQEWIEPGVGCLYSEHAA